MKRLYIGIDPGPQTSGLVVYEHQPRGMRIAGRGRVMHSNKAATLPDIRELLKLSRTDGSVTVVLERTQAGPPSGAVVETTMVVGRILERCLALGLPCDTYYRRDVLQALGCARKGNKDSLVRAALIELHGGTKRIACGTKASPGPLYGVSSHAWQALGVVVAHIMPWVRADG